MSCLEETEPRDEARGRQDRWTQGRVAAGDWAVEAAAPVRQAQGGWDRARDADVWAALALVPAEVAFVQVVVRRLYIREAFRAHKLNVHSVVLP